MAAPLVKHPSPAPIFPEHQRFSRPRSYRQKRESKSSADAEPEAEADSEAYHIPQELLEALLHQEQLDLEKYYYYQLQPFILLFVKNFLRYYIF